jgi:transposase
VIHVFPFHGLTSSWLEALCHTPRWYTFGRLRLVHISTVNDIQLLNASEDFQRLHGLVQEFWKIVRERKQDQLSEWLIRSKNSGIVELKNFALGLEKDLKAVEASLTYEWSNGPVEGHNNRLKMIKRQMYGRAKFDLLKQRVLYP